MQTKYWKERQRHAADLDRPRAVIYILDPDSDNETVDRELPPADTQRWLCERAASQLDALVVAVIHGNVSSSHRQARMWEMLDELREDPPIEWLIVCSLSVLAETVTEAVERGWAIGCAGTKIVSARWDENAGRSRRIPAIVG